MSYWWAIPITAILSSLLTVLSVYAIYIWRIKPQIDERVAEIKQEVAGLEQRVATGVRQGISDSIRDVSDKAVRSTTRSMVRMGTDLVEGGLSSILSDRGRKKGDS